MPIIKSAKKKARQALTHFDRNQSTRTKVKTYMKKVLTMDKTKAEDAKKLLSEAFSVIDTACKKHLMHPNTAARRKSRLARSVGLMK